MTVVRVRLIPPSPKAYAALCEASGWGEISHEVAESALAASIIDVTCWSGDKLVGMGRVVGDGVLYFYLQDIIVPPNLQGQGIGQVIVGKLVSEVKARAPEGATIGLMAAVGKESYYENFGFRRRPGRGLGAGMTQFIL